MRIKHAVIISLILCLITLVFAGCQNERLSQTLPVDSTFNTCSNPNSESKYRVLECKYSDSIPEAKHITEYTFWSGEDKSEPAIEQEITITIGNQTITGQYKQSRHRSPNTYPSRDYLDADGNHFSVDDTGLLDSYFWGSEEKNNTFKNTYTEKECLEIAKDFLRCLIDIDAYTVAINRHSNIAGYEFIFTKFLNGYETTDSAIVTVLENGSLYSYSATMLGRIPDTDAIEVDYDAIVESVYSKLDTIYSQVKGKYTSVTYELLNLKYTVLENGRLAMYCVVDVNCERYVDGVGSINQGERVILVVEL